MPMFKWLAKIFNRAPSRVRYEVIQDRGNGYYQWGGELYKSDILRSCIQPHVSAIGKLTPVHVKAEGDEADYFYIRKILTEPNPYMAGCMLQEKLAAQLTLNRNAFAYINRDHNGYPIELYPLPVMSAEAIYDRGYNLYLRFVLRNGRMVTYPYRDVIHLRRDYYENDIFGTSAQEALTPLMELVGTSDKGLMDAIKNGAIIRWLVKWNQTIRPEDLKKQAENFAEMYLSTEGNGTGVAATDAKAEVQQIKPNDYVPNVLQTDRTERRIYSFFGVNQNIVQNSYTEDEWNAFYEAQIEPVAKQMSDEFTRKLFSPRERQAGHRITFGANSLQYASMSTKLNLLQMVDRGAMTPNEWREVLNMAPIEGGDRPIRRLDTAVVGGGGEEE
ncbi:phage portal protein [Cloacibacillus sp. An23]|nr:phage portal protein [Cloacibacillus sp. An23]